MASEVQINVSLDEARAIRFSLMQTIADTGESNVFSKVQKAVQRAEEKANRPASKKLVLSGNYMTMEKVHDEETGFSQTVF